MLELNACASIPFCNKAHLYFRLQSRVVLPVGCDIPGEHQPRVRLPHEHATPVARASVPWISNRNPVPLAVPPLRWIDATAPLWRTPLTTT
jgi:hypothetical protein